jgi:hypothetical protein
MVRVGMSEIIMLESITSLIHDHIIYSLFYDNQN